MTRKIFIFVIAQMLFIHSAVIDNCVRYSTPADSSKPNCFSCRDGFFINQGSCTDCANTAVPQCVGTKPAPTNSSTNNDPTSASALKKPSLLKATLPTNDSAWTQIQMLSSKFENCKEIDSNGSCLSCIGNYKLSPDAICVKVQAQPTQDKLLNCLVFSQVENKCLFCDDGFMLDSTNICKTDTSGKGSPITVNNIKIVAASSDLLLAQSDKVSTLSFSGTQNVNDSNNESAKKNPAIDGQILFQGQANQTKVLNTSNSIDKNSKVEQTLIVSSVPASANTSNGIKVTVIVDNSLQQQIRVVQVDNDNCQEYKPDTTTCMKCKLGFILNPLSSKCVTLNRPIDLNSTISRIFKPLDQKPMGSNIANSAVSGNKTQNTINVTVNTSQNNVTNQTNTNTSVGNSTLNNNTATNNSSIVSNATNMNNTNTGNSASVKNNTAGNSTNNNTTNNSTVSNTSSASVVSNNSIKSSATITSTTISAAATSPPVPTPAAIPSASAPSSANTPNTSINNKNTNTTNTNTINSSNNSNSSNTKYNVTVTTDAKTGLTITTVGTTTNPPSANIVKYCIKYRDITYECLQCDNKYNLHQGKCYDNYQYSQILIKNKRTIYGNTIAG